MAWTHCATCGTEINENEQTCGSCGSAQPTRTEVSRWRRLGGALIDGLSQAAIVFPAAYALGILPMLVRPQDVTPQVILLVIACGGAAFMILNGYLLYKNGQTIGKLAMGTRIVDMEGNTPSLGRILILRFLVLNAASQIPIIGTLVGVVDALFIFGKDRRCLHDYIAGTRVIPA